MRAAVYYETGGPEVFRYEEVPDPALRPGGVIVEVRAVGIQVDAGNPRGFGCYIPGDAKPGSRAASVVR